jgi:transcriptional regulator with XRE-family HTH domain
MEPPYTESQVAELLGISPARVGQLRRGRSVWRRGRIEWAEEPILEEGVDYVWIRRRVMYTLAGFNKLEEQRKAQSK